MPIEMNTRVTKHVSTLRMAGLKPKMKGKTISCTHSFKLFAIDVANVHFRFGSRISMLALRKYGHAKNRCTHFCRSFLYVGSRYISYTFLFRFKFKQS